MRSELLAAWLGTVRKFGPKRAIVQASDRRSVTFTEMDALASAWLLKHAPDPTGLAGRAVVFAEPNGIGWFEIFIGLLRAGAIAVPLDSAEPAAAQRELAASLRAGFLWERGALVRLPSSRRYRDSRTSFIKLTSGSTGRSRPLVFTAKQLLADAKQVTLSMGINARDTNYALIPFGHSYGMGNLTLPLVAMGVPVVCGSGPMPHAVAADLESWLPSVFPGVPVLWRALAEMGGAKEDQVRLQGLRLCISAGAPLAPEVARAFHARTGLRLHNFYGASETGGISYDRSGSATLTGGVGRPLRGVKVELGRGKRLKVTSDAVFTHENRRRKSGVGSWVLPDLVAEDSLGRLTILGRRGATVKIAGRRVNLAEVAARLCKVAGVREVWVGVGEGAEPVLGAAVATDKSRNELREALVIDTPSWKVPKRWIVVKELPVTSRGKTDVKRLQACLSDLELGVSRSKGE